jgi:hypothetical protein
MPEWAGAWQAPDLQRIGRALLAQATARDRT